MPWSKVILDVIATEVGTQFDRSSTIITNAVDETGRIKNIPMTDLARCGLVG